ncbi:inositol-tetrakisphosphate 1-kinase-like [Asterias rubens]|uniref:inositol-tetrakisphosphate 1-kinase-like n=1 Tax=Asterias rubens TaxID=7604 RepID=UPI0014558B54|nr:inositol-tetrakisphosphate 1-kinase-like [Asterias rubens]
MKKVGYWMTEKKLKKLDFHTIFSGLCRKKNIELVKIDLLQPLEAQGPFSVIIHKLTDVLSLAHDGDKKSQMMMDNLKTYTKDHPNVPILDPLDSVCKLMDRNASYTLFQNAFQKTSVHGKVLVPNFVEIHTKDVAEIKRLLEGAKVKYPFVCKSSKAHGSVKSHEMAIIFNDAGLKDIEPPCVAMTFINHNAQMHKIFIIGHDFLLVKRPSIKNFVSAGLSDKSTIFFHSHDVSKPHSSSFLNELDKNDLNRETVLPSNEILEELVSAVTQSLQLSLFGFDVIVENDTGVHYVIDINAFPGYDGVPMFYEKLLDYIQRLISISETNCTGTNHTTSNNRTHNDNAVPNHSLQDGWRDVRNLKRSLREREGFVTNGNTSKQSKCLAK